MDETGIYWSSGSVRTIGGITRYLQEVVTDRTASIAERIHSYAVQFSPVRTGAYRASWTISLGLSGITPAAGGTVTAPVAPKKSKAPSHSRFKLNTFYVGNAIPYAGYIEYGTPKMAAQRVLARAIQAAGL